MEKLIGTLAQSLAERFEELAGKLKALAEPLREQQFWTKPFAFGNSFGHLVLHLTGNLNYYIGAQIAETGYIRDRPREFAETEWPSKEEVLKRFEAAAAMVVNTIRAQSEGDWEQAYSGRGVEEATNRLAIVVICLTHLDHHVGQMQYLSFALASRA